MNNESSFKLFGGGNPEMVWVAMFFGRRRRRCTVYFA